MDLILRKLDKELKSVLDEVGAKMGEFDFAVKISRSMLEPKYQFTLPSKQARKLQLEPGVPHTLTFIVDHPHEYQVRFVRQTHPGGGWRCVSSDWKTFVVCHPLDVRETITFQRRTPHSDDVKYDVSTSFLDALREGGKRLSKKQTAFWKRSKSKPKQASTSVKIKIASSDDEANFADEASFKF